MGIPNTITKVINRDKKIIDFDISKTAHSITAAIMDVESTIQWIAECRAKKYADKIKDSVYNEFYNFNEILNALIKKYLSFNESERVRRLERQFAVERLAVLALESYSDITDSIAFNDFTGHLISAALLLILRKSEYSLNNEQINEIKFLIIKRSEQIKEIGITEEQLYPTTNLIMDTLERELKNIGEIELAEGYMLFREGEIKVRNGELSKNQFTNNGLPRDLSRRTLEFNIMNDCDTIFALNEWIYGKSGKKIETLIKISEQRYYNDVTAAANMILDRKEQVKMIIVAGPSSSNKTTTTAIIKEILSKNGLKLKQLNIDDYYKDIDEQPKDEYGDFDFEMPEAIDINLLNRHFIDLIDGKTIQKPNFNFKLERRVSYNDFLLEKDEILLIDCLHGLYKSITGSVPRTKKFSIYIESMNILRNTDGAYTRWTDIRMLKRMIRDTNFRGYETSETLAHWMYVRKGELKHIIPYIFSTDVIINSGLPYELPALKKALTNLFPDKEFIEKMRLQGRLDGYVRGVRVRNLLETVAPLEDLSIIPANSPLREFIGGSSYTIAHN